MTVQYSKERNSITFRRQLRQLLCEVFSIGLPRHAVGPGGGIPLQREVAPLVPNGLEIAELGGNVIIEFPDMDAVERWYKSDDYKPLLEMRLGAARGNFIAVNGI